VLQGGVELDKEARDGKGASDHVHARRPGGQVHRGPERLRRDHGAGQRLLPLIQIDALERRQVVAHMYNFGDGVIICPKTPERATLVVSTGFEAGMTPTSADQAAGIGLLWASGSAF
jgi:hypothetical protein